MTDNAKENVTSNPAGASQTTSGSPEVLYSERQWVPAWWWIIGIAFAALLGAQMGNNRGFWWFAITFVLVASVIVWFLLHLSSTVVKVEKDSDGTRWLVVGDANLPDNVVKRSLAVPKSAKQNALGRQLDPAAYLIHHAWVKELALFVLDDPEDPTPYWLVSSKNPEKLLRAFVPAQAEQAIAPLQKG
ncbi:DUF3093 domain-containing protein [uncultured Corynebacterium sp.]|uniref:DUF3093 domain-containing protein n=1 Tax=uncultured Corynebacterium sp. TaxID=159447 RepID=UPI0025D63A3D|nr:DUF3093 domain-containing protein [uncultured Corynebacterium sp.]